MVKSKLELERYLLLGSSLARRVVFSLRSGSNRLRIETGRWRREKEEDRVCKFCESKEIENEVHFAVSCENYGDLRLNFFFKFCRLPMGD